MYYVYRFLDKAQNVIYVGKSKQDLEIRFAGHLHLPKECYAMVHKIQYISCKTESDMSIKEIYYINQYKSDEHYFFNILDTTEPAKSVEFNDKWKMYRGPLPAHFSRSLNFKKGYVSQRETKYNKDGSLNKSKNNREKGVSSYVEGLTKDEVDLIINYLIDNLNNSTNNNQEQIRFRNLVMFVLGVNLPIKSTELLSLKYSDLFDKKDKLKKFEFELGRQHHDEKINIPLRSVAANILVAYTKKYNLSYKNNFDDNLFESREHHLVNSKSWWRILNDAGTAVGINKNIGVESLRKTYGVNIYKSSRNKLKALLFLGEIWGQEREAEIISYLGLADDKVDFDYYSGEAFAIGNVDLTKIKCLKQKRRTRDDF